MMMIKRRNKKKIIRFLTAFTLLALLVFGVGRLYFEVTGGFTIGNISSNFPSDPRWETDPIDGEELSQILNQPFYYLGKGCQSYVFSSEDGQYVIKFFKYQHYRPKPWLTLFGFIPSVAKYHEEHAEKKKKLFEGFYTSWKIGYEHLRDETGIVYVHLNKTNSLNQKIVIYDKMGIEHRLEADQMEFMVQKRAEMLCQAIDAWIAAGKNDQVKALLTDLVQLIAGEYKKGFTDKDHALMQNTGIFEGRPMHVDVGQFVFDERMKNPEVADQEIFNRTYKFRLWLEKNHPHLVSHLDEQLRGVMGDKYFQLKYIPKVK